METVNLLGVDIACLDQAGLITQALAWSFDHQLRVIAYANAHTLNLAYADPGFATLLRKSDLVYADGISLVWSARLFGEGRLHKLTGADWIEPLSAQAAALGVSLYLLGGRPGVAQKASENLLIAHPSLTIVGTADGFFVEKSAAQVAAEIAACRPGLVLVGLGAPLQERWIAAWRGSFPGGVCWGVGALLDYLAGAEQRVPAWLDRFGLEWAWRLGQDPAGKWRRYLLGNPLFVWRVLRQYFTDRASPKAHKE